ncbi:beta-ketoacyl-ACP synthase III [Saccharothrix sp. NPDC042600]|uniref:beta-ketoacyl-ACP synthase III n=1 Tax=Saccharothrix TaxID=2071 RepID=UPI0034039893|nr:ketoacyl-ACP synthase III [Saccharothrix mutabilis subsp. capreolus]
MTGDRFRPHHPRSAPGSRIVGLGHYLPAAVVDNDRLSARLGVDPDWILRRTGIRERRVCADDETVVDMAVRAAGDALRHAGVPPHDVDAVVVATSTPPSPMPNCAARVAARLGLDRPAAFDVNAACAGFCYALACADAMVRGGQARTVVVVGADRSSSWLDPGDRDTAVLFGDGAGAVVLTAAAEPAVGPVVWGSVGELSDKVVIDERDRVLRQDGRAVFRWATGLAPVVRDLCDRSGLRPSELAAFVPHQANLRIITALAAELELGDAVVATDVADFGNTIAATVPVALSRLAHGARPPVGPVLLFGFGAGLTYAGQVVVL